MVGEICNTCKLNKTDFVNTANGKMCNSCYTELQDRDDIANVIPIRLPEGLVAFWVDSSSYISKKTKQRYFKIPDKVKSSIIHGKDYQIIIREV